MAKQRLPDGSDEVTDVKKRDDDKRKEVILKILVSRFQTIVIMMLPVTSDVELFSQACGGDPARTARCMANGVAMNGVIGLLVNQIGGKLSDAIGRKKLFMLGPFMNILAAALVTSKPRSLRALTLARVLRTVISSFAGTVVTQASVCDVCEGSELALTSSRMQAVVGATISVVPFLESFVLKASGKNPVFTYKFLGAMAMAQLGYAALSYPETLDASKRVTTAQVLESISTFNPLSFLRVYTGKYPRELKQLLTVFALQCCSEGRCTAEIYQHWARNNLQWSNEQNRNFLSFWGAVVMLSGTFVAPRLLKSLPARAFTTLANLTFLFGISLWGTTRFKGALMWLATPLFSPGVNGNGTHAVKALASDLAAQLGIGKGEFAAWMLNFRTFAVSLGAVIYGRWYARCQERRAISPGSVWMLAGVLGGLLPQVIIWSMSADAFEQQKPKPDASERQGSKSDASRCIDTTVVSPTAMGA